MKIHHNYYRRTVFLLLAGTLALCPAASGAEPAPVQFKAGAAKREITPKEPQPMWGYGARHDALSSGVLDPLYATAVVIQAGEKKLAIVGLDLGRAPAERSVQNIRQALKSTLGIEYSFIAGSHTHHGPVLELTNEEGKGKGRFDAALRYYAQMEEGIVGAVSEAAAKVVPAKLAVGAVKLEGYNRNRHTKIEPKPVDRELGVIRLDDAAGKPLGILVNFTAHPTMVPGETLKFSADYPGALKGEVEQAFGGLAVFMQGAAGDMSVNAGTNRDYQAFGKSLGRQVIQLASSLSTKEVTAPALEVREERLKFASRTDLSNPLTRAIYGRAFFPELVPNYADEYSDGIRPRLTVALLNGELALVGVSGEFFASHAIRLKERARVKQLFFFGYCNGYHQYFPTIEAVAEGGYGADSGVAPAALGAGEEIMNRALIWIYEMLDKRKSP